MYMYKLNFNLFSQQTRDGISSPKKYLSGALTLHVVPKFPDTTGVVHVHVTTIF
jgi:hypothetical protein